MKRTLIATLLAMSIAGPAIAADLDGPIYGPQPGEFLDAQPVAELRRELWDAGYAGIVGMYGDAGVSAYYDRAGHGRASSDPEGFSGGVFFGKNWRLNRLFFLGVEGEIGFAAFDADDKQVYVDDHVLETGLSGGYGMATGRVGFLLKDQLGIYLKAGGIAMDAENRIWGDDGDGDQDAFDSAFVGGFVWGGGMEWAFDERSSLRLEYLRVEFEPHKGISTGGERYKFSSDADLWRLGVAFRF